MNWCFWTEYEQKSRVSDAHCMRYAITWLVLALVVALGIGSLNWSGYRRIASRRVSSEAVVVELLPDVHNTVRYEYAHGGRIFQGQMQSWPPNPPLEQLRVGQRLVIYVDPARPEKSVLGDPAPILRNETVSIVLAAVGLPTFLVVVWVWRSLRKCADQTVAARTAVMGRIENKP